MSKLFQVNFSSFGITVDSLQLEPSQLEIFSIPLKKAASSRINIHESLEIILLLYFTIFTSTFLVEDTKSTSTTRSQSSSFDTPPVEKLIIFQKKLNLQYVHYVNNCVSNFIWFNSRSYYL